MYTIRFVTTRECYYFFYFDYYDADWTLKCDVLQTQY